MDRHWSEFQTVSQTVYRQAIANACAIPADFLSTQSARVARAYEAGEPIWMIADELRVVFEAMPPRPTKTPRDLALRVVRVA